jgi:metal-responsive CopG/Arc/MetJ family transcriptional regulator
MVRNTKILSYSISNEIASELEQLFEQLNIGNRSKFIESLYREFLERQKKSPATD